MGPLTRFRSPHWPVISAFPGVEDLLTGSDRLARRDPQPVLGPANIVISQLAPAREQGHRGRIERIAVRVASQGVVDTWIVSIPVQINIIGSAECSAAAEVPREQVTFLRGIQAQLEIHDVRELSGASRLRRLGVPVDR